MHCERLVGSNHAFTNTLDMHVNNCYLKTRIHQLLLSIESFFFGEKGLASRNSLTVYEHNILVHNDQSD